MSFYRNVIAAVAALGLSVCAFADDNMNNATTTTDTTTTTQEHTMQSSDASAMQDKVDLNKADAKELMKVKGISSAKAKAIVSYRKKHGEFKSVDEIKQVKGFKNTNEKTMDKIMDQLTVG